MCVSCRFANFFADGEQFTPKELEDYEQFDESGYEMQQILASKRIDNRDFENVKTAQYLLIYTNYMQHIK